MLGCEDGCSDEAELTHGTKEGEVRSGNREMLWAVRIVRIAILSNITGMSDWDSKKEYSEVIVEWRVAVSDDG